MALMIDSHLKETEVTYTIGNLGIGPVKEEEDWGTGIYTIGNLGIGPVKEEEDWGTGIDL